MTIFFVPVSDPVGRIFMAFEIFGWQKDSTSPASGSVLLKTDKGETKDPKVQGSPKDAPGKTGSQMPRTREGIEGRPEKQSTPKSRGREIYSQARREFSGLKKTGVSRKDLTGLDNYFKQVEQDLGQLRNQPEKPGRQESQSGKERLPFRQASTGETDSRPAKGSTVAKDQPPPEQEKQSQPRPRLKSFNTGTGRETFTEQMKRQQAEDQREMRLIRQAMKKAETLKTKEGEGKSRDKLPGEDVRHHGRLPKDVAGEEVKKEIARFTRADEKMEDGKSPGKHHKTGDGKDTQSRDSRLPSGDRLPQGLDESRGKQEQGKFTTSRHDKPLMDRLEDLGRKTLQKGRVSEKNPDEKSVSRSRQFTETNLMDKAGATQEKVLSAKGSQKPLARSRQFTETNLMDKAGATQEKVLSAKDSQKPLEGTGKTPPNKALKNPLTSMSRVLLKDEPAGRGAVSATETEVSDKPVTFTTTDSLGSLSRVQLGAQRLESQLDGMKNPQVRDTFFEELSSKTSKPEGRESFLYLMDSLSRRPERRDAMFRGLVEFTGTGEGRKTAGFLFENIAGDPKSCSSFLEGLADSRNIPIPEMIRNLGNDDGASGNFAQVLARGALGQKGARHAGEVLLKVSGSGESSDILLETLVRTGDTPAGARDLGLMMESLGGDTQASSRLMKTLTAGGADVRSHFINKAGKSSAISTGFLVAASKASESSAGFRHVSKIISEAVESPRNGESLISILSQGSSTDRGLANTGRFLAAIRMDSRVSGDFLTVIQRQSHGPGVENLISVLSNMDKTPRIQQELLWVIHSAGGTDEGTAVLSSILQTAGENPRLARGLLGAMAGGSREAEGVKVLGNILKELENNPRGRESLVSLLARESATSDGIAGLARLFENIRTDGDVSAGVLGMLSHQGRDNPGGNSLGRILTGIKGSDDASANFIGVMSSGTLRRDGVRHALEFLELARTRGEFREEFPGIMVRASSSQDGARQMGQVLRNISRDQQGSNVFLGILADAPQQKSSSPQALASFLKNMSRDSDASASLSVYLNSIAEDPSGIKMLTRLTGEMATRGEESAHFINALGSGARRPDGGDAVAGILEKIEANPEARRNILKVLASASDNPDGLKAVAGLMEKIRDNPRAMESFARIMEKPDTAGNASDSAGKVFTRPLEGGSLGRLLDNISRDSKASAGLLSIAMGDAGESSGGGLIKTLLTSRVQVESGRAVRLLASGTETPEGLGFITNMMEKISGDSSQSRKFISTINHSLSSRQGLPEASGIMERIAGKPRSSGAFLDVLTASFEGDRSASPGRILLEQSAVDNRASRVFSQILSSATDSESSRQALTKFASRAGSDPGTAGFLVDVLNRRGNQEGGIETLGRIVSAKNSRGESSFPATAVLAGASSTTQGQQGVVDFLDLLSNGGDTSASLVKSMSDATDNTKGIRQFESLMSNIAREPRLGEALGRVIARGVGEPQGSEELVNLIANCGKSHEASGGLLGAIASGRSQDAGMVVRQILKNPEGTAPLMILLTVGAEDSQSGRASAIILQAVATDRESSNALISGLLGEASEYGGAGTVGSIFRQASASPEVSHGLVSVMAESASNSEGLAGIGSLCQTLSTSLEDYASLMKMETASLKHDDIGSAFASLMNNLAEDPPGAGAYFRGQALATMDREGMEAFSGRMQALSTKPQATASYFNALGNYAGLSRENMDMIALTLKNAGQDRSAATALVDAHSTAAWSREGRSALTNYFNAISGDDHTLLSHFRMQQGADHDSTAGFRKAMSRDARLEASYTRAENNYRQLETRYVEFCHRLEEISVSKSARQEFFSDIRERTSTPEGARDFARLIDVASKDRDTWSSFNANFSILAGAPDKEGIFPAIMKNISASKALGESFIGALSSTTATSEGLNHFEMLMSKASENALNIEALHDNLSQGIKNNPAQYSTLMKNISRRPETAQKFFDSTARSTAGRDGVGAFVSTLEGLSENIAPREAYFRVWTDVLETPAGRESFALLGDNTRSSSRVRNQLIQALTQLNTTDEGREIFARFVKNIAQDPATSRVFLERLNKMSLDKKASVQLEQFVEAASGSAGGREALTDIMGRFASDKKGRLLIKGLLNNDQVRETIPLDGPGLRTAGARTIDMRGSEPVPGNITVQQTRYMDGLRARPLIHLLSQQTGNTQSGIKDSRLMLKMEGPSSPGQQVHSVSPTSRGGLNLNLTGPRNRIIDARYDQRVFDARSYQKTVDLRLAATGSSGRSEKVEKIWVELNRMRPPMDPREIYQESRVRYQLSCGNCGNRENYRPYVHGKLCQPCFTDYDRLEMMKSEITYRSRGGYINPNPDVISLSPEAARMFQVDDAGDDQEIMDIQTVNVMPTMKQMMEVARTGLNRRKPW